MTNKLNLMKEKAEVLKKERNIKRIKLFNWIRTFDYKNTNQFSYAYDDVFESHTYNLYLPKIDEMVVGFGDNYIQAFDDLVESANKLINEYLASHPNIKVKHFYNSDKHEVKFGPSNTPFITWNGEFLAKPFVGAITKTDLFKEVAKKYKSLEDDDFGFFFQAMSNTIFPTENTIDENIHNLTNGLREKYGDNLARVNVYYEDGLYITIGKVLYKDDYSK